MNSKLRRRLIKAAMLEDGFVHYDEVADILGLNADRLDHSPEMNQALYEISTHEHEGGRPLLTAVVVRREDLMPGAGFFRMAKHLGKQEPNEDDDAFFIAELRRVREYWGPKSGEESKTGVCPPEAASPTRGYRTILREQITTRDSAEFNYCTERFSCVDNSRIFWRVKRRRSWALLLGGGEAWLHISLKEAQTGDLAENAIRQEPGGMVWLTLFKHPFKDVEENGHVVIQEGGAYYLDIMWANLITWWEVEVKEPIL